MPTDGFLTYGDLIIVALVGLAFVLRNAWDFARYNHDHVESEDPHLAAHPLAAVSTVASRALAAAAFPHATRASKRPMLKRRKAPERARSQRPVLTHRTA